jgi:hypothetical protein
MSLPLDDHPLSDSHRALLLQLLPPGAISTPAALANDLEAHGIPSADSSGLLDRAVAANVLLSFAPFPPASSPPASSPTATYLCQVVAPLPSVSESEALLAVTQGTPSAKSVQWSIEALRQRIAGLEKELQKLESVDQPKKLPSAAQRRRIMFVSSAALTQSLLSI